MNSYNINYTFYVQSVEDFNRQLREWELQHQQAEAEIDVTDTTLAQEMLQAIGVNV